MPSSFLSSSLIGMRVTDKGGHAVFAREEIAPGSILAVWGGTVITARELALRPLSERRLTLQVEEDAYLVSDEEGPADWINHSCDPNSGLRGQITLVAMRPIRPAEEVCFDYAMSDGSHYDTFTCNCGAANCRGRVTGDDWMRDDLIARYGEYFSPFLRERIRRLGGTATPETPRTQASLNDAGNEEAPARIQQLRIHEAIPPTSDSAQYRFLATSPKRL